MKESDSYSNYQKLQAADLLIVAYEKLSRARAAYAGYGSYENEMSWDKAAAEVDKAKEHYVRIKGT